MKLFLVSVLFLLGFQIAAANPPKKMKVHIVTWNNDRFTGRLDSISSNSISIESKRGKIMTFTADETKNLKIWRAGIILPVTLAASVAIPVLLSSGDSPRSCTDAMVVILGIPAGAVAGLLSGDLIATKFNRKRMHLSEFNFVIRKIK